MKPLLWDAINPFTGQPFTWDDPNLRWGDPSTYLEPGDPGFVPYPASLTPATPQPKRKTKAMSKSAYLNASDDAFAAQLLQFKTALGGYATLLGLTPAQVTAQGQDADYFNFCLASQKLAQGCAQQWTAWKNLTRVGGASSSPPAALTLPAAPAAVPPGIEVRFRALVKVIKASPAYNPAIGEALGIEGAELAGPDLATISPSLDLRIVGSQVQIGWTWQGHSRDLDCIRIEVDRGDGRGFTLLAMDTTPGYNDTAPFPAAPARWRYRAIFCVADAPVGQWSDAVEITVG